jgi:hypothetical protein
MTRDWNSDIAGKLTVFQKRTVKRVKPLSHWLRMLRWRVCHRDVWVSFCVMVTN